MDEEHAVLDLTLFVPSKETGLLDAIIANPELDSERFAGAGIDGGGDLVTVVVGLTSASLTALVAILRAHWGRSKAVKIEVDGIKVEGASPEEINDLLSKLLDERRYQKSKSESDDQAD